MLRALIFAVCCFFAVSAAQAQTFNAQERAEIRAVVRDYLVRNPDVLREALEALEAQAAEERRVRIETDTRDFSIGPADAPIVIVEFFDYRCGFCRAALDWANEVQRGRNDVRFVFKEFPILSQESLEAARAAIASIPQGRYLAFHRALMSYTGELNSAEIDRIARQAGVDVARMRRRMDDPVSGAQIDALLQETRGLAVDLVGGGAPGTPLFMINGQVIQGFRREDLDAALREARRAAG